ncbi:hypothetical protein RFI_11745, partial [Reticulomyxa filosa]
VQEEGNYSPTMQCDLLALDMWRLIAESCIIGHEPNFQKEKEISKNFSELLRQAWQFKKVLDNDYVKWFESKEYRQTIGRQDLKNSNTADFVCQETLEYFAAMLQLENTLFAGQYWAGLFEMYHRKNYSRAIKKFLPLIDGSLPHAGLYAIFEYEYALAHYHLQDKNIFALSLCNSYHKCTQIPRLNEKYFQHLSEILTRNALNLRFPNKKDAVMLGKWLDKSNTVIAAIVDETPQVIQQLNDLELEQASIDMIEKQCNRIKAEWTKVPSFCLSNPFVKILSDNNVSSEGIETLKSFGLYSLEALEQNVLDKRHLIQYLHLSAGDVDNVLQVRIVEFKKNKKLKVQEILKNNFNQKIPYENAHKFSIQ